MPPVSTTLLGDNTQPPAVLNRRLFGPSVLCDPAVAAVKSTFPVKVLFPVPKAV